MISIPSTAYEYEYEYEYSAANVRINPTQNETNETTGCNSNNDNDYNNTSGYSHTYYNNCNKNTFRKWRRKSEEETFIIMNHKNKAKKWKASTVGHQTHIPSLQIILITIMTLSQIVSMASKSSIIPSCQAFQISSHNHRSSFVPIPSSPSTTLSISSSSYFPSSSSYSSSYSSSSSLYMGKGDGKKKRKKKSALSSTSSSLSSSTTSPIPQPAPMRVTNDSLVPVRRQIRWAQMKKEAMKNSGTSFRQTNVRRTKYRKSLDEEEIEEARLERQKRGQDVNWDVILNATASTPLVIVDGYNIIHKYPRLKKWMKKSMLSKARSLLTHDMEELSALKGWRIEVVFDGYGRDINGPLGYTSGSQLSRERISKSDQEASKKVTSNGVRVVFSGKGMSADNYIESRCFEAKKVTDGKLTGSLIIATDDNLIRSAGVSSGAVSMSANRLIDELRALRKATLYRVEAAVAKANGHAIRPAKLMGTAMPSKLTRGAIIIEDKRNRPKKKKKKEDGEQSRTLEDLKKGTTSLPSWAVVPPKDT